MKRNSERIARKMEKIANEERTKKIQADFAIIEQLKADAAQRLIYEAGGGLPEQLSEDDSVDNEFSSPLCFDTLQKYILNKKGEMPDRDLIPALINIMNDKGFTITYENFMELYDYLYTESNRTNSTKSIDAQTFFTLVRKWFNTDINSYDTTVTRGHVTPADISRIVKAFDPSYEPVYDKIAKPKEIKVVDREEYTYLYEHKLGVGVGGGGGEDMYKKPCGNCWLCGLPVYMYKFFNTTSNSIEYSPCGDDEHVIPPYIGNLFGTLHFDYNTTMKYYGNKTSSILAHGIKPAHKYCNMIKLQCIFIQLPLRPGEQCRINIKLLDLFMKIFMRNLNDFHYSDDTNKYHIKKHFYPYPDGKIVDKTREKKMKDSIISQLEPILRTLNANGSEKVCFSLQLKTIWFVCKMCIRMVNKAMLERNKETARKKSKTRGGSSTEDAAIDSMMKQTDELEMKSEKVKDYVEIMSKEVLSIFKHETECTTELDDNWLTDIHDSHKITSIQKHGKTEKIDETTYRYYEDEIRDTDTGKKKKIKIYTSIDERVVNEPYHARVETLRNNCYKKLQVGIKTKVDKIESVITQLKKIRSELGPYWAAPTSDTRKGGRRKNKSNKITRKRK